MTGRNDFNDGRKNHRFQNDTATSFKMTLGSFILTLHNQYGITNTYITNTKERKANRIPGLLHTLSFR